MLSDCGLRNAERGMAGRNVGTFRRSNVRTLIVAAALIVSFGLALGTTCFAQAGLAMPKIEIGVGQAKGRSRCRAAFRYCSS